MPDMHHIAILHDVVFAFETQRAFGSRVRFGTRFQQLIPANCLCANEMVFEVGVDRTGAILRAAYSPESSRRGIRLLRP